MKQSEANEYEQRISRDKASNFRGKARVKLDVLHFTHENLRDLKRKNVERLKEIFKEEGCLREEPERHVPAVVSMVDLTQAIEFTGSSEVSINKLLENPRELPPMLKFPPGAHIECLSGKHRIQAAKECTILKPSERWWIVDLYLEGLSQDSKRALSEEYSNSVNFSDGILYRRIVHYQSLGDMFAQFQCWARLTKSKREILRRFQKRESFSTAFNRLLPIYGIWVDNDEGFSIGTLHKMIGMKADEELIHYTDHILATWEKAFRGIKELMHLTDPETVKQIKSMAPGASQNDLEVVLRLMRENRIFSNIQDVRQREDIDLIYFRPCTLIMRRLFMESKRRSKFSIREAAEHGFSGANQTDGQVIIQTSESSFKSCPGTLTNQIVVGYLQLYSYAMRFVLDMMPDCAKKEDGQETPQPRKPNPRAWQGIGILAYRLGFESPEIHRLRMNDADREIARDTLLRARDPTRYKYPDGVFEDLVKQVAEKFDCAVETSHASAAPSLFVDGLGEDISRRCGRLRGTAYEDSQPFLFFEHLNKASEGTGKGITSFFVRKSVFNAFFGAVDLLPGEPAATQQRNATSSQNAITGDRDVTMDGPAAKVFQAPTRNPKRSAEDDHAQPFEFNIGQPRMYPVPAEGDRAKKIVLSEKPNAAAYNVSTGRRRLPNTEFRKSVRASQDRQQHSQTRNAVIFPGAQPTGPTAEFPARQQEVQTSSEPSVSISIWEDGKWKQVERDCTRVQLQEKVMHYIWTYDGLHPYDDGGRGLYPEQCFDAVIDERAKTVFLAHPLDHDAAFEL